MKTIYLDNSATTKVDERAVKEMNKYHSRVYGNASSLHAKGREAKKALENARRVIAESINASPEEIIFTSGGTESNNLALQEIAFQAKLENNKNHIITTSIEHDSIINVCKFLEKYGFKVSYLKVDNEGFIDTKQLENEIREDTILVSIIHGNNEIGTIQDLERIGRICREKGVLFHTDACQSYMKTELDVKKMNLDLASLNAHKLHGPKGVGALYVRKEVKIKPLLFGGGQERNIRSGTENLPGIAGFAKAVDIYSKSDVGKMEKLRDYLIKNLEKIPQTYLNGSRKNRLCNNVNVRFKGIEGESVLLRLDSEGVEVSTGSACSSKSLEPSHVLLAIGVKAEDAHGSIRISLGRENTKQEVDKFLKIIPVIVKELRQISPFWS